MRSILIVALIMINASLLTAAGTMLGRQIAKADSERKDTEIAEQNARNGLR